jgi:hemerythrin-like domain-containing protein
MLLTALFDLGVRSILFCKYVIFHESIKKTSCSNKKAIDYSFIPLSSLNTSMLHNFFNTFKIVKKTMASSTITTDNFNTSDTKWQVSDKFKPDKEDSWTYPASSDGWVLAHNMIRHEIDTLLQGLECISNKFPNATPSWAVESIRQVWDHHQVSVHDHHSNEDNITTPFIKKRVNLPDKLEADHVIVVGCMDSVSNAIKELKEGDSLSSLVSAMAEYKEKMFPHLQEEEQIALPLLRSYFTAKEFKPVTEQIVKKIGKYEMGSFIHTMGENTFRSKFMKQEGIPFFVWYIQFKGDYNSFLNDILCHMEALKKGVPPAAITGRSFSIFC